MLKVTPRERIQHLTGFNSLSPHKSLGIHNLGKGPSKRMGLHFSHIQYKCQVCYTLKNDNHYSYI